MDSSKSTSTKSTNPNLNPSRKPKKSYHIGGMQVEFPYQPYGTQLAFMGRVISTLDRAQRDGHCHALLESPTGTGKSLSLLCSALAWQQSFKSKNLKPDPEAMSDPLGHGGGFIPETQQPSKQTQPETSNKAQTKKKAVPTIYYSTRTHSQITQVIREYRKTSYRAPMAILASRKHYCTNPLVNGMDNIDDQCKQLLKDKEGGCLQFKNALKVRSHPSLRKGGCHEIHDIEDLVKVGHAVQGCSYYAARTMATDAHLVFCPYNYIINPVIRGAMEVDIKGSIIILDEAHNIEDVCRDAGSVDVEEDILQKLQMELEQLCAVEPMTYQPLYEMSQELISWIERRKSTLQKHEFQHYVSCWTGDDALKELQEANISQQCFPILLQCAVKAIKAATDAEEITHLSGMSVMVLEGLFSSLTYFFSRNGSHACDYQLALRRYIRKENKNVVGGWTHTINLWCLNPAVVFRDIADLSLSVILASGTLSPMKSFSSELGVQFGSCLEAPHVIDSDTQVQVAVVTTSPDDYPLNASYKTADSYEFQDALGKALEEILGVVPDGSLVFFPSYKLMEKVCNRWCETGQWARLISRKSFFVEPRGGSQEEFDSVLKGYYDSVSRRNLPAVGRKKRAKRLGLARQMAIEPVDSAKQEGSALLAVCRGKVSEGLDFSDANARVVIVVGIPFPNINDIQVGLKKKYNDTYRTSKNLLSGSEWYCHQAFRALNQAIGRCIRHRFDYGAIILLDERYIEERNRVYISKWLRKSIRQYDSFSATLEGLKSFYKNAKETVSKCVTALSSDDGANQEKDILLVSQNQTCTGNRNFEPTKSDHCVEKPVSLTDFDTTSLKPTSPGYVEVQASLQEVGKIASCGEIIDLECDSPQQLSDSVTLSQEDAEVTIVKETPSFAGNGTAGSPGSFSMNGNSNLTGIHTSSEFIEQASSYSVSVTNDIGDHKRTPSSIAATPKKEQTAKNCSPITEESTFNSSVNSHTWKRRKFMSPPLGNVIDAGHSPDCCSFMPSSNGITDTNRRIEFGHSRPQSTKLNSTQPLPTNISASTSPCASSGHISESLQIFCSICKSPFGLPENNLYVNCSSTLSSKVYLASLRKERLGHPAINTSLNIPILMADVSMVDQRLINITQGDGPGNGMWCEQDGCVFSSIFCPFCSTPNCVGAQVKASDASNVQFLNKILFFHDLLEVQILDIKKDKEPKTKVRLPQLSTIMRSLMEKNEALESIGRFAYSPQQNTGGWRTTKSKLRLPKKG